MGTPHFSRASSTQNMDTLADLASMQNHQPVKSTPPLNSRDSSDSHRSSGVFPYLSSSSASSNPRASFDIAMVDTPKQILRSDFSGTSLSVEAQQTLSALVGHVQQSPSAYESHKEIIKILHHGFVDHIYPSSSPNARRDPHTYDLLAELRQARENMDKLFAVGEEQWQDWLQDESILAQTAEERVAVVDKCRRAVSEEYGSVKLWTTFGDWVLHCHHWALDAAGDAASDGALDTERMIGREVFDHQVVLDTWTEAVERTQHDLRDSHLVWDKYLRVRFPHWDQKMAAGDASAALDLFHGRLGVPHAQWDQTFQAFSTFVSANFPADEYEGLMATTLRDAAAAKRQWSDRDALETALTESQRMGDQAAEYDAFSRYIEWERGEQDKSLPRKSRGKRDAAAVPPPALDMVSSLYQRAELRFPSAVAVWEAHTDYLVENSKPGLLDVLMRATKHCPWSGSLWKQYLLTSELSEASFDETEKIKHQATSTGLLDAAGIEEALIVHDAWCGYLLRRTRRNDAVEEDADVAEMGIRSSIETMQSLASKSGLTPDFDQGFRLQRKYIEYLKSQGRLDNARAQFDDAIRDYGTHYKFWLRFYEFELQKSIHMASLQQDARQGGPVHASAPFAAAILKRGLQQPELDYPEYLMEALLDHCEDHEEAEELQSAISLVRTVQKQLVVRRQREAVQAAQIADDSREAEVEPAQRTEAVPNGLHIGKRKRESEDQGEDRGRHDHNSNKRSRNDDAAEESTELRASTEEPPKRDREHASILVQNVPQNISDTKIRQYFSACGNVQSLEILHDEENSVVVEFEDAQDAEYALSRNGQELEGSILSVERHSGATLYITNYPATADESYIRHLLRAYGDIVNVRFPSLQGNKRRRFCYVEFKEPHQARAATELDGRDVEGLKIVAKISNPAARHARVERENDGRTIFVGQIPFKATQPEIEKAFSTYGAIESVKLPQDQHMKGRNKGIAFLTFATNEAATAALAMDGQDFKGRKLVVSIGHESGAMRTTLAKMLRSSKSPTPYAASASSPSAPALSGVEERRQRTIAIAGVPDTVNESRVRALAERIGPVRKVILKTNHHGALVEFENVADTGRAMIELDGHEIDPGKQISVVTEQELLQLGPERKTDKIGQTVATKSLAAGPVRRPIQPGVRKGGHLGQKTGSIFADRNKDDKVQDGDGAGTKKSNADFRAMLVKGS